MNNSYIILPKLDYTPNAIPSRSPPRQEIKANA